MLTMVSKWLFFNKASLMTLENMYNISAQNQIGQVNVLPSLGQITAYEEHVLFVSNQIYYWI